MTTMGCKRARCFYCNIPFEWMDSDIHSIPFGNTIEWICDKCNQMGLDSFVQLTQVTQYSIDMYAMWCGFEDANELINGDGSIDELIAWNCWVRNMSINSPGMIRLPEGAEPISKYVFHFEDGGDVGDFYVDPNVKCWVTADFQIYVHMRLIGALK